MSSVIIMSVRVMMLKLVVNIVSMSGSMLFGSGLFVCVVSIVVV